LAIGVGYTRAYGAADGSVNGFGSTIGSPVCRWITATGQDSVPPGPVG
jgi:hypothetical protein